MHITFLLMKKYLFNLSSSGLHLLLNLLLSAYNVVVDRGTETLSTVALVMRSALKCEILDVIMGLESL